MKMMLAILMLGLATAASGQLIHEDLKILPDDGAEGDRFGWSIAIDSGVVAIGAWGEDDNDTNAGSAYLFDASTGEQLAKFRPIDRSEQDLFGSSIALDNGVVAVGARGDGEFEYMFTGSAYLFDAATGAQLFKLLPSDGTAGLEFSLSIAIENGVVAVGVPGDGDNGGASGSVYLFEVSTGAMLFKLLASDGAEFDRFGISVAIENGIVAVGARGDNNHGDTSGSAYLFDASTGAQLAKLLPSDGAADDRFGSSVAIDNGVVAVGASWDDDNGDRSGSAYLFDAFTGAQLFKLLPTDGAADDRFGRTIAIANDVVAVGAWGDDDNGDRSGSVYLFSASTGAQLAKLLPSDGVAEDHFGSSIAIDNSVVVVGASGNDDNGDRSGSAYVFDVTTLPCPGDIANELGELNPDGTVSFGDFMAMLALVGPCPGGTPGCDGDIADDFGTLGADGMVGFGDFLALLGLVGPCP